MFRGNSKQRVSAPMTNCLFQLEKDPGGEGAKVVPSTKQLYEGDQSG